MERCERLRLFRIWQGGARKGRCGRQDLFGSGSARLGNTDQVGQAGRGLARCVLVGKCLGWACPCSGPSGQARRVRPVAVRLDTAGSGRRVPAAPGKDYLAAA